MTFILAAVHVIIDRILGTKPILGDRNIVGGNITQDRYPFWGSK
jgi:hypothetical protein